MKEKLIKGIDFVLGKKEGLASTNLETVKTDNTSTKLKQLRTLIAVLLIIGLIIGSITLFIKQKTESKGKVLVEEQVLTVELADKTLDPEKHWRNYYEEKLEQVQKEVENKLQDLTSQQEDIINKTNQRIEEELAETNEKLFIARQELLSASQELQRVTSRTQERPIETNHLAAELGEQEFDYEVELDSPKSAKNYIPEGTYFTGHLLGGIAVSTGLNTPDENATPVAIKLVGRVDAHSRQTTNLSPLNEMDLGNCRIMGSSYGDLSSERAIVRLEKMVCEQDGVYITSKIAGQIFGPDGLNGVKGTVIATASKLVKNAVIGGLISGISSAAKGQDVATISGTGLVQTTKKGAKDLLGQGAWQGASNSGDKIADYYLRQAEAMSPILTVPSGVRVNAQITKGFFVGEVSTHKRIKEDRTGNNSFGEGNGRIRQSRTSNGTSNSRIANIGTSNSYNSSDIPEDNKSEYRQ